MTADQDDELAAQLDAARIAHQAAHADARRLVLCHLPPGAPDLASLDDERRRVVQRWHAAEAEYDRLRLLLYAQVQRERDAPPAAHARQAGREASHDG